MSRSDAAGTSPEGSVRSATVEDVDRIVDALTTAFLNDPLWGPAFPEVRRRATQAAAFWRLFATSSLRYPWTLVTTRVESVALWIPPGGNELADSEQAGYEEFVVGLTGPHVAEGILAISELFETARPSEPHFYLSLFATHDDHRGRGLGMGLLREGLARIDALGLPTYLESSNPANDARYRSVGFTVREEIQTASGPAVSTMWRPGKQG